MKVINIAMQFTTVPAGRYPSDGEYSGQRFREELLVPSLKREDCVIVEIDGTAGYGSSFLEEAFGGLVRKGYYTAPQLHKKLEIRTADPSYRTYKASIWRFIDQAKREMADAN
jgi:hypothetical protein